MATINDRNNPSFSLFPINNNRTAWRPFGIPTILVVPRVRDISGTPLANSRVFNVRIYIENVPSVARVAGHQNIGRRFPDRELYAENISSLDLAERLVDLNTAKILRDGVEIDLTQAEEGDLIEMITRTGVTDTIPFLPDADYYDLSDITIETDTLPSDDYILVYESQFFTRTITNDGLEQFLCIDPATVGTGQFKFDIKHPGEVIDEFYNLTPPPYLSSAVKSQDTTVALYRPFTDIVQDVYDEQELLESANWVFDVPAESIPYLSSLLGWEIPYFPESLDSLRRAVLRRTVEFQNLKGSRRAIVNIFKLFGFEILISNLWWSSDGKRFIRPGETLPDEYKDEEIGITEVCQVDALLDEYDTTGFGNFSIPFAYRPQEVVGVNFDAVRDGGDITIEAYRVVKGSEADLALQQIASDIQDNPSTYGISGGCFVDTNGYQVHNTISSTMDGLEVKGFSQILITGNSGEATSEITTGENPPLMSSNVSFDRETNNLHMVINGHVSEQTESIYAFAIYNRRDLQVPDALKDLRSNRFDVQVLTEELTEFADPTTLDFAIEFLFRLKAFHSLLNVISLDIDLNESYEVTDWCVGGDVSQRYDTDAGTLQVPPAIIPGIPAEINDCTQLDPKNLGYKDDDLLLRNRKLEILPNEFEAWKSLDSRSDASDDLIRLAPLVAAAGRTSCRYTHHGQDRIAIQERVESKDYEYGPDPNAGKQAAGLINNSRLSPVDESTSGDFNKSGQFTSSNSDSSAYGKFAREYTEIRTTLCEEDGSDYCYAGRVNDELLYQQTLLPEEHPRCKPCALGLGVGVYYTYPSFSKRVVAGVQTPSRGSSSLKILFSGNAPTETRQWFKEGIQEEYLTASYDEPLALKNNSWLGRLYRGYGVPGSETIHYWNNVTVPDINQQQSLALQRPSLEIEKTNLHFPGTRFPRLSGLENDYTHPTYKHRPWDSEYADLCGAPTCGNEPTYLNCTLELDTLGNETMVFDSVDYSVAGNGLKEDIWNLDSSDLSVPGDLHYDKDDIIHSIYSSGSNDSPYVTFEGLNDFDESVPYTTLEINNGIANLSTGQANGSNPYEPIFPSYNDDCLTDVFDFADGYASSRGLTPSSLPGFQYPEVLEGLGMTNVTEETSSAVDTYFILSSSILEENGLRLDCGCLILACNEGTDDFTTSEGICSVDSFIDSEGYYDFNCDHLEVERNMVLWESVGACSSRLDGSIPSLLELS